MDCIFCKIIAGEIPSHNIYEDDRAVVFLNIAPMSEGHSLIVPKTHADMLCAGSREDAAYLMEVAYDIAPKMMKALGASGFNLSTNHGVSAGQEVMHTHLHLMPRKDGVPRTFIRTNPSQDELAAVADKIRSGM